MHEYPPNADARNPNTCCLKGNGFIKHHRLTPRGAHTATYRPAASGASPNRVTICHHAPANTSHDNTAPTATHIHSAGTTPRLQQSAMLSRSPPLREDRRAAERRKLNANSYREFSSSRNRTTSTPRTRRARAQNCHCVGARRYQPPPTTRPQGVHQTARASHRLPRAILH